LLNGHTITIKKPFTIGNGDFSLTRGTVKYTGGGTFGSVCGGLYLNQITFDGIECDRLFNVTGSGKGKVKVNDCRFTNCTFNGNGAFYFNQTGNYEVSFINNRFYDCTNDGGTMIYIDDISGSTRSYENHAKFNMTNCVFDNCRNNGNDGGCIYLNVMYVDVGDLEGKGKNIINNCYAKQYGGAIYDNDTYSYGTFKGFICSNNKSGAAGGAMYLAAGYIRVEDCTFFNNSAGNDAYGDAYLERRNVCGGAIYLEERKYVMTNCYFTENSAYKGGAVYDEESDTAYTNCYFVYDKATCGTANEITGFKSMNGCHLYNSSMDRIFDNAWNSYSSKQTGCSGNTPENFLEYRGAGTDPNPYTISSQKLVYLTYVNTKYVNKSLNSGKFAITADNLIWFAKLTGFTGSIDGRKNNLYLVGTADAIADGGKATNYTIENRNGTYSIGIGNGTGTLLSSGSIIIICVVGGVALITAGVYIFLHVKKKKKSE
ncbi:MAG: hypothetical protein MJ101_00570, partial [Clostridia bacterium]|nr:hypothetical protein [Clostridia bacterium]